MSVFDQTLERLAARPHPIAPSQVTSYVDDRTAQIVDGKGSTSLLVSSAPLRARDDSGEVSPIDLRLTDAGSIFEPRNPQVDLSIPAYPDQAIVIGRGEEHAVGVRLAGANPNAAGLKVEDTQVLYPNVATDSDLIVASAEAGVELFSQLRSPDSPETQSFPLELPPGAELRETAIGSVEIRMDNQVIASVQMPVAFDAQGEPVPTSMRVDGDALEVTTPHRGRDLAYPILVDPLIRRYTFSFGHQGWSFVNSGGYGFYECPAQTSFSSSFCATYASPSYLQLWSYPGAWHVPGQHALWQWFAPHFVPYNPDSTTAWIDRVDFINFYYERAGYTAWDSYLYMGIVDWRAGNWTGTPYAASGVYPLPSGSNIYGNHTVTASGNDGHGVYFMLYDHSSSWHDYWRAAGFSGANIYLKDPEAPSAAVANHTLPSGWLDHAAPTFDLNASDPGLGVLELKFFRPKIGGPIDFGALGRYENVTTQTSGCSRSVCPTNLSHTFSYDTANMPEGVRTLWVNSLDPLTDDPAHTTKTEWTVPIDRSPPDFQATGTLTTNDGQGYELDVHATDGDRGTHDPAHASTARSGVKSIEVLVDNERVAYIEQPCTDSWGSCPLDLPHYEMNASAYQEGDHQIKVIVTDQLGHIATQEWTKTVENSPVVITSVQGPSGWLDTANSSITVNAADAGTGVERIKVTLPGGQVLEHAFPCIPLCPRNVSHEFNFDPTNLPEGVRTATVRAYGLGGLSESNPATTPVSVDHSDPGLELSGSLFDPNAPGDELTATATDGDGSSTLLARSGVKSLDLFIDGVLVDHAEQACPGPLGSCPMTKDFDLDGATSTGNEILVRATDHAGNTTTRDTAEFEPTAPSAGAIRRIEHQRFVAGQGFVAGTALEEWIDGAQNPGPDISTHVLAKHAAGISRLEVRFPGPLTQGGPDPHTTTFSPSCQQGCPTQLEIGQVLPLGPFAYDTAYLDEGINRVPVLAFGSQGEQIGEASFDIKADRTPGPSSGQNPEDSIDVGYRPINGVDLVEVDTDDHLGGDGIPLAAVGTLHISAKDPVPQGAPPDLPRSGVASVEVRVDGVRHAYEHQACPQSSCEMDTDFELRVGDYGPGTHDLEITATDHAGHGWTVNRILITPGTQTEDPRARLGLEEYFDYEPLATGAGSSAQVNLDNGNLVWHKTPIVNPGRGLSTAANISYNSQERSLLPDLDVDLQALDQLGVIDLDQLHALGLPTSVSSLELGYDEAGRGVSVGISGLTRINEPLGGRLLDPQNPLGILNPLSVELRDPDGTVHTFQTKLQGDLSSLNPFSYEAPPGVHLHLRRYQLVDAGVLEAQLADLSIADLSALPSDVLSTRLLDKAWAITQPSGVTHFFNVLGYQTGVEDRNGNKLRFDYELHSPLTGGPCTGLDLVGDLPATDLVDLRGICEPRLTKVVDAAGRALDVTYKPGGIIQNLLGTAAAGKLDRLTDHGRRSTELGYDADGNLETVREGLTENSESPSDDPDARTTILDYDDPQTAQAPFDYPKLTGVTDPRGNRTSFSYGSGGDAGLGVLARPVVGIDDRRQPEAGRHRVDIFYDSPKTIVTDQRSQNWSHELDSRGRLAQTTDPLGISTALTWDADNNVISKTEGIAPSNGAPATTRYSYNTNGLLTSQVDPLGRLTLLGYENSQGTHISQYPDPHRPGHSIDYVDENENDGFVSDLVSIRKPAGNQWDFQLDDNDDSANVGNVTAELAPEVDDVRARTESDYDEFGQITEKREQFAGSGTDPQFNVTRYEDYDANGMPQAVIDPRGTDQIDDDPQQYGGNAHRWVFGYDATGNLTQVTDPRGSQPGGPGSQGEEFTSSFVYDAFDREVSARIPKCSDSSMPACPFGPADNEPRYLERRQAYDLNGNLRTSTEGDYATTEYSYGKTDLPVGVEDPEQGLTTREYDGVGDLVREVSPRANAGQSGPVSAYQLDGVGRVLAEIQKGSGGPDLITTYAYDARNNILREADPRWNAGLTVDQAIARLQSPDPEFGTHGYGYNVADELIVRTTNDNEGDPTAWAGISIENFSYDENGNLLSKNIGYSAASTLGLPVSFWPAPSYHSYNARDELVQTMDATLNATRFTRRLDGRVTAVTSGRGTATDAPGDFTTEYEYLPTGEVSSRSIPYQDGQYGKSTEELEAARVTYERDPVGNPLSIRDAVGNVALWRNDSQTAADHTFTNTFFDTGELRSTTRPSWWALDWRGGSEGLIPDPGRAFSLAATPGARPDLEIITDGPSLSERVPGASVESAPGAQSTPTDRSQPAGPGDFGRVTPQQRPSFMPLAGSTWFAYDDAMRMRTITNAQNQTSDIAYDGAGRVVTKSWPFGTDGRMTHTYAYDPNGNLKQFDDGRGSWGFDYDEFDRLVEERAPGAPSGTNDPSPGGPEITRFAYDENGNLRFRCLPEHQYGSGPCPSAAPGGGQFFEYRYDGANNLDFERNPAGAEYQYVWGGGMLAESVSPRGLPTYFYRDPAGRVISEFSWGPNVTEGCCTSYPSWIASTLWEYDEDGNPTEIKRGRIQTGPGSDEEPQVVTQEFDGLGLLAKQTTGSRPYDSADHTGDQRTTITEHDPNGNLTRTLNPAALNDDGQPKADAEPNDSSFNSTVRVYNADDLLTQIHLPWDEGDRVDQNTVRRYKTGIARDSLGRIRAVRHPHVAPNGSIMPAGQVPTTCYEHFPNGWIRSSSDQELVENDFNSGTCAAVNERTFTYDYDQQGNQTLWRAESPSGQKTRRVTRSYYPNGTLADREAQGHSGGPNRYRYYYNGNRSLAQFGEVGSGGDLQNATTIQRDKAEHESLVDAPGTEVDSQFIYDVAGDLIERRTDGTWTQQGGFAGGARTYFKYDTLGRETEMRHQPAEPGLPIHVTRSYYYPMSHKARQVEWRDAADAPVLSDTQYYTPAQQEVGADVVESYFYDTDGQINRMQRRAGDTQNHYKNQSYLYDKNGNRIQDERGFYQYNARDHLTEWTRGPTEPHSGTTITYQLDGDGEIKSQVDEALPSQEQKSCYQYDPNANNQIQRVVDGLASLECSDLIPAGFRTSTYTHDLFGNVTQIQVQQGVSSSTTTYAYDDFGRRVSNDSGGPSESYTYDALDRRATRSPGSSGYAYVGTSEMLSRETGSSAKSYDYDSIGLRQGQVVGGTAPRYSSYALDVQGSVEGLETDDGHLPSENRYHYDPYGELQGSGTDPESELSAEARANPFRFQGFYYDAGIKTYDMQARSYRPDLGQFLSEDRFEAAGLDLSLQSDPLTQNRYAFAGGNPVSRVEFDGHDPCSGPHQRKGCEGGLVRDRKHNVIGTPAANRCDCDYAREGYGQYSHPDSALAADLGIIDPVSGFPVRPDPFSVPQWLSGSSAQSSGSGASVATRCALTSSSFCGRSDPTPISPPPFGDPDLSLVIQTAEGSAAGLVAAFDRMGPKRLKQLERRIAAYEALDPVATPAEQTRAAGTRASAKAQRDSLLKRLNALPALRRAKAALPYVGGAWTFYENSQRYGLVEAGFRTAGTTAGATSVGYLGAVACSATTVGAVGCGLAGAAFGGWAGDQVAGAAYDAADELSRNAVDLLP